MKDRYDIEIIRADGDPDSKRWVNYAEVIRLLYTLREGDDMVVHHVGSVEPGVEYG